MNGVDLHKWPNGCWLESGPVWDYGSLAIWQSGSLVRTVQSPPAAAARFGGRGRQETNDITQYLPQLEEAGFDGWWWPRAFIGSGDSNVSIHHK